MFSNFLICHAVLLRFQEYDLNYIILVYYDICGHHHYYKYVTFNCNIHYYHCYYHYCHYHNLTICTIRNITILLSLSCATRCLGINDVARAVPIVLRRKQVGLHR